MTPEQLETLFNQRGYILVWNMREYAPFRPIDIQGQAVRTGACYACSFSASILDTLSLEGATRFLEHEERLGIDWPDRVPFDTNSTYQVGLPKKQVLPEWRGWSLEKLRCLLKPQ